MGFNDFRRRMTTKMFFEETTAGIFERNKNFHIKSNRWVDEQYNEIDNFCFKLRDGITNLLKSSPWKLNKIFLTKNFLKSKK